jgi:hypothetical protein
MARIESHLISGGSSSAITGSGSANQVAVFSSAQVIGGSSGLTYDGTTLQVACTTINLAPGSGANVAIKHNSSDGSVQVSGGSTGSLGANIIVYGQSHATKAGDTEIRNDTTNIFSYDASATDLIVTNGVDFCMGNGIIRANASAGLIGVSGGTSQNGGGNIIGYASDHASKANRLELRSGSDNGIVINGNANSITLEFNVFSQGTFQHNGALLSFYSATPVVQAAAITAPSGGAIIDAEARTAIASILNVIKASGGVGLTA